MIGELAQSFETDLLRVFVRGIETDPVRVFALVLSSNIVKTILDAIVGAAGNDFGHFGPVAANGVVEMKYCGVFDGSPVGVFETGIEVIDVSFATLFPGAVGE